MCALKKGYACDVIHLAILIAAVLRRLPPLKGLDDKATPISRCVYYTTYTICGIWVSITIEDTHGRAVARARRTKRSREYNAIQIFGENPGRRV